MAFDPDIEADLLRLFDLVETGSPVPIPDAGSYKVVGEEDGELLFAEEAYRVFDQIIERLARSSLAEGDDVVAVSMLSVRVPGRASLGLLEQRPAEFNDLLREIPKEVDLWEADESVVAPGSAAGRLWQLLVGLKGVNWVTAGKLLARKRPRLIPVYDRVLKAAFDRPDGGHWWRPLQAILRDNPELVTRLEDLRRESGIGQDISLLRVLDVAVWMRNHGKPEPAPDAED